MRRSRISETSMASEASPQSCVVPCEFVNVVPRRQACTPYRRNDQLWSLQLSPVSNTALAGTGYHTSSACTLEADDNPMTQATTAARTLISYFHKSDEVVFSNLAA